MPKVPVYDNLKVAPTSIPNVDVSAPITPDAASISDRQMGQLGKAISGTSQDLLKIQLDASEVRATDAANKFKQELTRQMFGDPSDPSSGIVNQKGVNAFQRVGPDGPRDLYSEAQENMDKAYSKIASDLSDDTQRGMFAVKAREYKDQHLSNVLRHQSSEWNGYQVSVAEETIKTAQKNMGINYKNPDILKKEMDNIYDGVKKIANIKGTQGSVESDSRNLISKSLQEAAKQSIFNKDLSSARFLLKNYKDKWEMDDMVSTETLLRTETNKAIVESVSGQIKNWATPKIYTNQADRLVNLMMESGVILKAENGDPEKDQFNKIKNEFAKRYKDFDGNVDATIASFSRGDGGVDVVKSAIAQAGSQGRMPAGEAKQVKDFLPGDLNDFASQIMDRFNKGLGVSRAPTVKEAKEYARSIVGPHASPELLKAAEARAESDLTDLYQSKRQEDDAWAASATQALARKEIGGDYNKLPTDILSALNSRPEAKKKVLEIADSMKKETGPELYIQLSNDAELGKLSKDELTMKLALLPRSEAISIGKRWQELQGGKASSSSETLEYSEADKMFDLYYAQEGKDPKPDAISMTFKEAAIERKEFYTFLMNTQQTIGKKLSPKEMQDFSKQYFEYRANKKVMKWKIPFDEVEVQIPIKVRDMKYSDLSKSEIESIKAGFARIGNYEPSEGEILRQAKQMIYSSQLDEIKKRFGGR